MQQQHQPTDLAQLVWVPVQAMLRGQTPILCLHTRMMHTQPVPLQQQTRRGTPTLTIAQLEARR